MNRASSLLEIKTRAPLPKNCALSDIMREIESLEKEKKIAQKNGFYSLKEQTDLLNSRTSQDFLLDMKWKRLLKKTKWFRHIPFVDFALISGSMSFGAIKETSDFDILLGVKEGRIFTARYLVSGLFSLFRARRLDDLSASSPDKFCFNHIVTRNAYEKQPHNYYRYELYRHLVPVVINKDAYELFREKNGWAMINELNTTMIPQQEKSKVRTFFEKALSGYFGDFIEICIARPIAKRRLSNYINRKNHNGRVVVNDNELEFHFLLNYEEQFKDFAFL